MVQLANMTGAIAASIAVACASLSGRLVVGLPATRLRRWLPWMQATAAGLLMGDAMLHMMPEAMERGISASGLGECILLGALALLGVECLVRARRQTTATFAKMDIIGDCVHHFVDGVVIGASFEIGLPLGALVALAILLHELPREAGNAGVLVAGGYAPKRAFGLSVMTTLAVPLGALMIAVIGQAPIFIRTSLALAAGTTLYLAVGDVIPGMWQNLGPRDRFTPLIGVAAGLIFMWGAAILDHAL
jgi:zinc and cadmium transporter